MEGEGTNIKGKNNNYKIINSPSYTNTDLMSLTK